MFASFLDLIAVILLIVTCARDFPRLPPPSKVGAILIFVFDAVNFVGSFIPLLYISFWRSLGFTLVRMAVAVVYFVPLCLKQEYTGSQLSLAIGTLILTTIGGLVQMLDFALWKYWFVSKVFDRWRDTFDPDRSPVEDHSVHEH